MRVTVKQEMEVSFEQAKLMVPGDILHWEDQAWKILEVTDSTVMLWKCEGVTDHVFNENNSNVYEGSDIQKYLQTEFKDTVPEELKDCDFFLLTEEQIRKYMPREIDMIATNDEDRTTWYWTASPHVGSGSGVRIIYPSGDVYHSYAGSSHGVAPACILNL